MQKLLFLFFLLLAGCTSLQQQFQEQRPTPLTPIISPTELSIHLRSLNDPSTAGRATATPGFEEAALYVAGRLYEALLQPIADPDYLHPYTASVNIPIQATLVQHLIDSVRTFQAGSDFLIDARTASGLIRFNDVMLRPTPEERPLLWPVALLPTSEASTSYLEKLVQRGIRAALLVTDSLQPALASAPVDSLMLIQITFSTAACLLGLPASLLRLHLRTVRNQPFHLPGLVEMSTSTTYLPHTTAWNVGGYLAGKHPEHAYNLVIIATDMDGLGDYPGWGAFHPDYAGTSAAALLEVIRNLGSYSPYLQLPERTLLFLFLSGARVGNQGLKAFLEAPTWIPDSIQALIYVAPRPETLDYLTALAHRVPYRIEIVQAPPSPSLPADWSPGQVLEQERVRAQQLAEKTHHLLLPWIVTPYPFAPVSPDTLSPPGSED